MTLDDLALWLPALVVAIVLVLPAIAVLSRINGDDGDEK